MGHDRLPRSGKIILFFDDETLEELHSLIAGQSLVLQHEVMLVLTGIKPGRKYAPMKKYALIGKVRLATRVYRIRW